VAYIQELPVRSRFEAARNYMETVIDSAQISFELFDLLMQDKVFRPAGVNRVIIIYM